MLEIPESCNIARQISQTLTGRRVTDVQAAHSPHGFAWYLGDPTDYPRMLAGKTVNDAQALGGYVQTQIGDMDFIFHDGVNARYLPPEGKIPAKYQMLLSFDDGSRLYCTVQMYGGMMVCPTGSYDTEYYAPARDKPNPLTSTFDEKYFAALRAATPDKLSAKAFLATEQRIPGLGNGCLQDILFNARVHPQSKLAALSQKDIENLYHSVKETIAAMTDQGGRDTEKDFFSQPGGYSTIFSSKTWKRPCPHCDGEIQRKAYMGGNVYFCPSCQPLKK